MRKVVFREEFKNLPQKVNWFPGHMRKGLRLLENEVKKIDIFIEVRDARIPRTSHNTELTNLVPRHVKKLVLYNKIDLVPDKKALEEIKNIHNETKVPYFHLSTKKNVNINKLLQFISTNANP